MLNNNITNNVEEFNPPEIFAKELGIPLKTLKSRRSKGLSQERWGEITKRTRIPTGYTLEEAPKHLKEAAEKLAIGLSISALEAYQLLLEKIAF